MAESRSFHLGDLITAARDRFMSPDGIGGVYKIVDYVTGVQHMTHQLGRACQDIKPHLLEQHPWLADVPIPEDFKDEAHVWAWLAEMCEQHGMWHKVQPMEFGQYVGREPIAELREMAPDKALIVVDDQHHGQES